MWWVTVSLFLNTTVEPAGIEAGLGENDCLPLIPWIVIVTGVVEPPEPVGVGALGLPPPRPPPPQLTAAIAAANTTATTPRLRMKSPPEFRGNVGLHTSNADAGKFRRKTVELRGSWAWPLRPA